MRVKTDARREAIVQVAGELFLREGYAAVSMAAISAKVGGSRVTLYNYFSRKEELFEAFVIQAGRKQIASLDKLSAQKTGGLTARLRALGMGYLQLILDPQVAAIQRLTIGESRRFPELAKIFYEHGPRNMLERMTQMLGAEQEQGGLRSGDTQTLAVHFMALCEGRLKNRQLWGIDEKVDRRQVVMTVQCAVDAFLSGYAGEQ